MIILIKTIELLYNVFLIMIIAKILSSWVPDLQRTKVMQFISFYTDPYLDLFRRIIPPIGMIDLSPIAAIFALGIIKYLLIKLILLIFFY